MVIHKPAGVLTVPGKTDSYSKSQAGLVLQKFFDAYVVENFEVIHESANSMSQYCIGNLTTSLGLFRTTIYTKQKGEKQLIQELRFEK